MSTEIIVGQVIGAGVVQAAIWFTAAWFAFAGTYKRKLGEVMVIAGYCIAVVCCGIASAMLSNADDISRTIVIPLCICLVICFVLFQISKPPAHGAQTLPDPPGENLIDTSKNVRTAAKTIAREWLVLLACSIISLVILQVIILRTGGSVFATVYLFNFYDHSDRLIGWLFIAGVYFPIQLVRSAWWAIRVVRRQ